MSWHLVEISLLCEIDLFYSAQAVRIKSEPRPVFGRILSRIKTLKCCSVRNNTLSPTRLVHYSSQNHTYQPAVILVSANLFTQEATLAGPEIDYIGLAL